MKCIKLCILTSLLIVSTGILSINAQDIPLTNNQLEDMFPDKNFRKVIHAYFQNEDITLNKLNSLDGEFYASGEKISNLTGISYLKNIDDFVFWNNNIKTLPKEITTLSDIDSINIRNNYLTDDTTTKELINKDVDIDYDLNFIENEDHQYKLKSKYKTLNINKGNSVNITDILYKDISTYNKEWEVSNIISDDIILKGIDYDPEILTIDKNTLSLEGLNTGQSKVTFKINNNKNSTISLLVNVK